MASKPAMSTGILPAAVCPLRALVTSPVKWGDITCHFHLHSAPGTVMIIPHLTTINNSVLTALPTLIRISLKSILHMPARWSWSSHSPPETILLVCCFFLYSLWCPLQNSSFTLMFSMTSVRGEALAPEGWSSLCPPSCFCLCYAVLSLSVLFHSWASLKWESGNLGSSLSSATYWVGALN